MALPVTLNQDSSCEEIRAAVIFIHLSATSAGCYIHTKGKGHEVHR